MRSRHAFLDIIDVICCVGADTNCVCESFLTEIRHTPILTFYILQYPYVVEIIDISKSHNFVIGKMLCFAAAGN